MNLATRTVAPAVTVGSGTATGAAFSLDGSVVYITDSSNLHQAVSVLDVSTNSVLSSIEFGRHVLALTVSAAAVTSTSPTATARSMSSR